MSEFLLILMGFFIIVANIIGFIVYTKKKNLYFVALTILLLAASFGGLAGLLAILVIRDGFAIFYGLQIGYYLVINSVIILIVAILVTVIKKVNNSNV